jgi:hypothetical protein
MISTTATRSYTSTFGVVAILSIFISIGSAFQISLNGNVQRLALASQRETTGTAAWRNKQSSTTSTTRLYSADINSSTASPKKKKLKTFNRYLEIECWKNAEMRELESVFLAVAESCKQINRIVQRAQTDDLYGVALGKDGKPLDDNVQGEVQQQLDVLCNTIMLRAFCGSSCSIHSVASEEEDEPRCCSDVMVRS